MIKKTIKQTTPPSDIMLCFVMLLNNNKNKRSQQLSSQKLDGVAFNQQQNDDAEINPISAV